MYVCIYVCMYVCMYVYIYIYIHTHTRKEQAAHRARVDGRVLEARGVRLAAPSEGR